MWRIAGDVWDHWNQWPGKDWSQGLLGQFQLAAKWAPYAKAQHWPDLDMLPLGYLGPRPGEGTARKSGRTHEERRNADDIVVGFRSPLIAGGNLTETDDWTVVKSAKIGTLAMQRFSGFKLAAVEICLTALISRSIRCLGFCPFKPFPYQLFR
jgi:alpha-galactosidase